MNIVVIRQRLLRRRVSCKDVLRCLQRHTARRDAGCGRRGRDGGIGGGGGGRVEGGRGGEGGRGEGGGFYRNSVERNDDDEDYLGCFRSVGRARHNTEAPCVYISPFDDPRHPTKVIILIKYTFYLFFTHAAFIYYYYYYYYIVKRYCRLGA